MFKNLSLPPIPGASSFTHSIALPVAGYEVQSESPAAKILRQALISPKEQSIDTMINNLFGKNLNKTTLQELFNPQLGQPSLFLRLLAVKDAPVEVKNADHASRIVTPRVQAVAEAIIAKLKAISLSKEDVQFILGLTEDPKGNIDAACTEGGRKSRDIKGLAPLMSLSSTPQLPTTTLPRRLDPLTNPLKKTGSKQPKPPSEPPTSNGRPPLRHRASKAVPVSSIAAPSQSIPTEDHPLVLSFQSALQNPPADSRALVDQFRSDPSVPLEVKLKIASLLISYFSENPLQISSSPLSGCITIDESTIEPVCLQLKVLLESPLQPKQLDFVAKMIMKIDTKIAIYQVDDNHSAAALLKNHVDTLKAAFLWAAGLAAPSNTIPFPLDTRTESPTFTEIMENTKFMNSKQSLSVTTTEDSQSFKNWKTVFKTVHESSAKEGPLTLTVDTLNGWHNSLYEGCDIDSATFKEQKPGELRSHDVGTTDGLSGYEVYYLPTSQVSTAMTQFVSWFNETSTKVAQGEMSPYEFSARADMLLISIHPFPDGNGRITNLVRDLILMKYTSSGPTVYDSRAPIYCGVGEYVEHVPTRPEVSKLAENIRLGQYTSSF